MTSSPKATLEESGEPPVWGQPASVSPCGERGGGAEGGPASPLVTLGDFWWLCPGWGPSGLPISCRGMVPGAAATPHSHPRLCHPALGAPTEGPAGHRGAGLPAPGPVPVPAVPRRWQCAVVGGGCCSPRGPGGRWGQTSPPALPGVPPRPPAHRHGAARSHPGDLAPAQAGGTGQEAPLALLSPRCPLVPAATPLPSGSCLAVALLGPRTGLSYRGPKPQTCPPSGDIPILGTPRLWPGHGAEGAGSSATRCPHSHQQPRGRCPEPWGAPCHGAPCPRRDTTGLPLSPSQWGSSCLQRMGQPPFSTTRGRLCCCVSPKLVGGVI